MSEDTSINKYKYDFVVSFMLSQFLLADYIAKFIETNKLADLSVLHPFVKENAFYLSSLSFVKELTILYHDVDNSTPFSFEETKAKIEHERSLLINRALLATEAKRELETNPTNELYKHVLYKALYNSHLFDDQSSKPLELESLDYDVTEKKYTPIYLFTNFDQTIVNLISRLFDPEDETIVNEVLSTLRGTKKYSAYEFYFNACETRLRTL